MEIFQSSGIVWNTGVPQRFPYLIFQLAMYTMCTMVYLSVFLSDISTYKTQHKCTMVSKQSRKVSARGFTLTLPPLSLRAAFNFGSRKRFWFPYKTVDRWLCMVWFVDLLTVTRDVLLLVKRCLRLLFYGQGSGRSPMKVMCPYFKVDGKYQH